MLEESAVEKTTPKDYTGFWVVVLASFLALALSGAPSPLYVLYEREWGIGTGAITIVYAIYAAGVITALLVLGGVSDRLGRRPVLLWSFSVLTFSCVLFLIAGDIYVLLAARFIQGIATGVLTGAIGGALSELHPKHNHRFAALANSSSTSIGIATGAVLSGLIATHSEHPLQIPFVVLLILCGCETLFLLLLVNETVDGGLNTKNILKLQRLSIPRNMRNAFLLGAAVVFAAWSIGGVYLALGGSIVKSLTSTQSLVLSGVCIVLVQGFGGLSQVILQALVQIDIISIIRFGLLSLFLGVLLSAVALLINVHWLFFIGALITGLGFGLSFLGGTSVVNVSSPTDKRGEVMASFFVVAYVGISIPALVAGFISEQIGINSTFIWFGSILGLVCLALVGISLKSFVHSLR